MRAFAEFRPYVLSIVSDGDELYAGGFFTTAGGVTADCIAKWDGSGWSPVGSGLSEAGMHAFSYHINSLVFYNSALYVGGDFDSIGGARARGIARRYKSVWGTAVPGIFHGQVDAMTVFRNELYITGGFDSLDGFFAGGIAKWNGAYWSPVGSDGKSRGGNAMLAYNDELYVGGPRGVMKWDGTTWTDMSAGLGTGYYISALAAYANKLYVSTAANYPPNAIMVWNDSSWTPIVTPRKGIFYAGLASYNGRLFAGGSYGSFDSSIGVTPSNGFASWNGSSWSAAAGGEIGGIATLTIHNGELYAGGGFTVAAGESIFSIAKLSMPTDVQGPTIERPKTYVLEHNYPNPFNPSTMIEYFLPKAAHVRLEIFDILGREIRTTVNDKQDAGFHRVTFDADGLRSGVYFYRIRTAAFVQTRSMSYLK